MTGRYLKKSDTGCQPIDFESFQAFHHPFAYSRSHNESFTIRWFVELPADRRVWINEFLIFLSRFQFATKEQILEFLTIRNLDTTILDEVFQELLLRRVINSFIYTEFSMPQEVETEFPDDAFVVYCMDLCASQILVHFYRDDFVYWRTSDCRRNSEQVLKYLSTCEFYLKLLKVKKDHLIQFWAVYDVSIGRRMSRYSSVFEVSDGSETTRKFILESVRSCDMDGYWDKKVADQVSPFVERGYWKQSFDKIPDFVLLAEDKETALAAASNMAHRLPKLSFCVTTDLEIKKGLENATFYRFIANDPNDEKSSASGELAPILASVFSKYESPRIPIPITKNGS